MKKKTCFFVFSIILLFYSCSQEANDDNRAFVQIENTRFYLRYSSKEDVETFLGQPSDVIFFERGGEGFYWNNFTIWGYENRMLSFHFNSEGKIIRVTVNADYSKNVFIFERALYGLDHATVTSLLEQLGINIFHTTASFIGAFKFDFEGTEISVSFWFDVESKVRWFQISYNMPWEERR